MARSTRYTWPEEAMEIVQGYLAQDHSNSVENRRPSSFRELVTVLVGLTGQSRRSCCRFARKSGVHTKQQYREWTRTEQQRLLDLIASNPPYEAAKILRRSVGSVYAMLHRLGASAQRGRDWFTVYVIAQVLHISAEEVKRWIARGWLKTRTVETGGLKKFIITSDDFNEFCLQYREQIVGRRLTIEMLDFVRLYVFPPSHAELLSLREAGYKPRQPKDGHFELPAGSDDNFLNETGTAG